MSNSLLSLPMLGATIKAHIEKGDYALNKADEHYRSAGCLLKEARDRLKKEGSPFTAFLVTHSIGRSRAYELIEIADGRKTLENVRERKATSMRRSRAAPHCPPRGGQPIETPERMQVFDRVVAKLKECDADALREIEKAPLRNAQLAAANAKIAALEREVARLRAEIARLQGSQRLAA